jgi:esterase/lipase
MTKRKKPKLPIVLRVIQFLFPLTEKLSVSLAAHWFIHLFFSPITYKPTVKEMEALALAKTYFLIIDGKKIHVATWGTGRAVLAIHGWAGRGTQFRKFILPLQQAGFKLVAIDGPAHGKSSGSRTEIREFSKVISAVYEKEDACAIVAHSFGGVASLYAMSEGLNNTIQINIASPTIGEEIIQTYIKAVGASQNIADAFKKYIIKKTGQPFEYFSALAIEKRIKHEANMLLVHDEEDAEVPVHHPLTLQKQNTSIQTLITKGLGHNRILKDESVIDKIVTFISERASGKV